MYGASINSDVGSVGNVMQLVIGGSVIADRYALHGEALLSELTELICDCLLAPNAKDGAFNAEEYQIAKQELLDAIDAEINNKRGYALMRARRTAFQSEPDAHPVYGTKEDVEQLTPESVYAAYCEILRRAVIRVYYVGSEEAPQLAGQLREAFGSLERAPEPLVFHAPSPYKPETVTVTEPMDVTQSKLVMVFKAHGVSAETLRMFSAVFGGTPFSLLFTNVREKESLCYYCASRVLVFKEALIVDSGVELANAERAREAILEQLDRMRRGDFEDILLENTKHSMVNALRSIGDTPGSCINEQFEKFCRQDNADVEERINRYLTLTKEDMAAVANALVLDTVYLMEQGGTA
ncbi:MAG: insulinase family protein, partial [Oscillospiraceae bacterium]|nr:insulinase family protein [Oscillospiraceae bacterium]